MINYGSSLQGRRSKNEDSFIICEPNKQTTFLAVADGMGGMPGGEIASKLVVDIAKKIIMEYFETKVEKSDLKLILIEIFSEAQKMIRNRIKKEFWLNGMGTTLCCMLIYDDIYVWGNIGDSRIYHFKQNVFHKITKDHSQLEEYPLQDKQELSTEMIQKFGHLLTRSVNGGSYEPDIYPYGLPFEKLNNGEGFIICSDGLLLDKYGNQSQLFHKHLIEADNIKEFTDNIIYHAYSMGSNDNITCVSIWRGWEEWKSKVST